MNDLQIADHSNAGKGKPFKENSMGERITVINELESGNTEVGYSVQNFDYQVFSSTTASIPPLDHLKNPKSDKISIIKEPRKLLSNIAGKVRPQLLRLYRAVRNQADRWALWVGVFAFILILLLLIIVGIQGSALSFERWLRQRQCQDPQCLIAAGDLHGKLNRTVSPCDNFYLYACGLHVDPRYWHGNPDSPAAQSRTAYTTNGQSPRFMQLSKGRQLLRIDRPAISHLAELNYHAIIHGMNRIFHDHEESMGNSAKYKISQWFVTCSNPYYRSWYGPKALWNATLTSLGGCWLLDKSATNQSGAGGPNGTTSWPEYMLWNRGLSKQLKMPPSWAWMDAVIKLQSLHIPIFVDFKIVQKTGSKPEIVVFPEEVSRNTVTERTQKSRVKADLQKLVGRVRVSSEDKELNKRIDIAISDTMKIISELRKMRRRSHSSKKPLNLGELNQNGRAFDWKGLFAGYFNEVDIRFNEDFIIYTEHEAYLKRLSPLIEELQRNYSRPVFDRMLNNYMIWRVIGSFDEHLSYEFEPMEISTESRDTDEEILCFQYVHNLFGTVLGAIYVENHLAEETEEQVKSMLVHLSSSLQAQVNHLPWMDEETRSKISKRVREMKIKFSVPEIMRDEAKLNYAYRNLKVSYVHSENLLSSIRYLRSIYNRVLAGVADPYENDWLARDVNVYDTKIGIQTLVDELFVPPGILQPPVYHHTFPASLNFAGLGSMVGSAMAELLGETGSYTFGNGLEHIWSTEMWKNYLKHWQCAYEQLTNITRTYFNTSTDASGAISNAATKVFDESSGLDIAIEALDSWLKKSGNSDVVKTLPGPYMPHDQLFFVVYAQTFCLLEDPNHLVYDALVADKALPPEIIVNQIMSEQPRFAEVFKCPPNSPMVPANRCTAAL
ncbi:unnamed protein product [Calicophoron daubneyi]|uniref:Endothelin-converting enzyme 1 n=1 Tax=Calicophoron daubneyi TaxID=300641 RepID=A0AAV2TS81_CALDB